MYACVYVAIHCPRGHNARACVQIDTVKIVSVDRVLTLNLAHQENVAIVDWTGMGLNLTIRSNCFGALTLLFLFTRRIAAGYLPGKRANI